MPGTQNYDGAAVKEGVGFTGGFESNFDFEPVVTSPLVHQFCVSFAEVRCSALLGLLLVPAKHRMLPA